MIVASLVVLKTMKIPALSIRSSITPSNTQYISPTQQMSMTSTQYRSITPSNTQYISPTQQMSMTSTQYCSIIPSNTLHPTPTLSNVQSSTMTQNPNPTRSIIHKPTSTHNTGDSPPQSVIPTISNENTKEDTKKKERFPIFLVSSGLLSLIVIINVVYSIMKTKSEEESPSMMVMSSLAESREINRPINPL